MQVNASYWLLLLAVCFASAEIKNKGWWRNTVFYQVYPRSLMDSDGDGIGDLKGIISKLEHFPDAGIDGIWMSPIYTSPMVDFGYDTANFTDVDYRFGTLTDFRALTARARELGIKVVLDFVPNHSSDQHVWFQKSLKGDDIYKDYYVWRVGKNNNTEPPNNWISIFGGPAWKFYEPRGLWYLHQFEYRQPDLNYTNPRVHEEMKKVLNFWLEMGADGFRIDAVPYFYENDELQDEPRSYAPGVTDQQVAYLKHLYTKDDPRNCELLKSWREVLDSFADAHNDDEKVMMTEAYANLSYTLGFYECGSNIPFNFKLVADVYPSSKPSEFQEVIDEWLDNMPPGYSANWLVGNHDRPRTGSRFPGRADQMTMLTMILPGVAVTYYGEEIGMVDKDDISWEDTQDPQACNAGKAFYRSLSRDPNRTPFQWDATKNAGFSTGNSTWLPVNQNYKELNLANQKTANVSHYKIYQALTALRRQQPALKDGSTKVLVLNDDQVLAVIRQIQTESVALLINFLDEQPQTVDLTGVLGTHTITTVAVASLDSNVEPGTTVDPSKVTIPAMASLVVISRD